ncbi:GDSL-type esterase/lipase family protein [uncultured Roseivirga sp.]|uniref:GDSL-type esterase/lipase family protein n=1 Tax=uncultured Roseivirga sp. TaxID=543088 RepID=UPI000D793C65|nr:GDSL-type esterase/lipase family protein [uncultured Roseivirga sp.]PWL27446.1 MAG: G-D-S-L family lipolytic protein [Roseivirga sp. XM-24bin3]
MKKTNYLLIILLLITSIDLFGQDPLRFAEEVKKFENASVQYPTQNRIVFTGSSSIRLWVDFKSYFPEHNVINTGFGGSETSDLIHYKDLLISQFNPKQVFIYEGDNDVNSGKSGLQILADMNKLVNDLLEEGVENIVIIAPKPSIARWELKEKYEKVNASFKAMADLSPNIQFADVWTPMLNEDGKVKSDIFVEDNLHMNKKGYDIWIKVIGPLLIKP